METTYVPEAKVGWWGGSDTRVRCVRDEKVVFDTLELAEKSAEKIRGRDNRYDNHLMTAYKGKCGNYHVGHSKARPLNN
jgi:hypothetical protein